MLQRVFEVAAAFVQVAALEATIVEVASETDGAKGAEKKARAIAQMRELFPPERLGFLAPHYDALAGLVIDVVVAWANQRGFFAKSR